ncbi:MAG: hypothetical protein D6689_11600 [Deltaproteobacteria bacterium]|nr:MAG: hypothetical protein D6689_11600 [Deltaproteobacteria bacterium]
MTANALVLFVCAGHAVVGCGGSAGGGSGDDLGSGTQTLVVTAAIEADNQIPNATDVNDFTTSFDVRVRRAGQDVADATVTVTSAAGAVTLAYSGDGRYRGAQVGYHEVYRLDVVAGDDDVTGARVDGPDIHVITAPQPGALVPRSADLVVEWARDETAEVAEIETKEMDKVAIDDTGTFTVPAAILNQDDSEIKDDEVRIWRTNRLSPAGGAGGSSLSVTVRNEIDVLVAP